MKTIRLIILVLIVNYSGHAQDPQLFDSDWYLEKVILDSVEYLRPFEDFEARVYFTLDDMEVVHPSCEEGFGSPIQYGIGVNSFNINDGGVALIGTCAHPDIINFMDKHYSVYLIDNEFARNPFTYVLETVNDHTSLTVINADGDQAIYGDALLSINDFSEDAISIYPNPVKDVLTIENDSYVKVESVKVYDVLGRLVLEDKEDLEQIDVSSLNSGVFFLNIKTDKGAITKKMIKE